MILVTPIDYQINIIHHPPLHFNRRGFWLTFSLETWTRTIEEPMLLEKLQHNEIDSLLSK